MNEVFKDAAEGVTIDAVEYVMNNIFDWDAQKEHAGLRMGFSDCKVLSQSLRQNLKSACPSVRDEALFEHYEDLLHNNWAGDFQQIQSLTADVVRASMEAEIGSAASLKELKHKMKGRIEFMETHYPDVRHPEELAVHVKAAIMEQRDDDSRRQGVQAMTDMADQARTIMGKASAAENAVMSRKFPLLYRMARRLGV